MSAGIPRRRFPDTFARADRSSAAMSDRGDSPRQPRRIRGFRTGARRERDSQARGTGVVPEGLPGRTGLQACSARPRASPPGPARCVRRYIHRTTRARSASGHRVHLQDRRAGPVAPGDRDRAAYRLRARVAVSPIRQWSERRSLAGSRSFRAPAIPLRMVRRACSG